METLLITQHRNQYYINGGNLNGVDGFCSSPSKGFQEINCRTFESAVGLLPTYNSPFKSYGSPVSSNPRVGSVRNAKSVPPKPSKKPVKSSPIDINLMGGTKKKLSRDSFSLSELWAGPTYSNSPPPSSVPIPKFSMKPKRTVSLELPVLESDLSLEPLSKSAPASPTRESVGPSVSLFRDDDSATKVLRRILNLDTLDD